MLKLFNFILILFLLSYPTKAIPKSNDLPLNKTILLNMNVNNKAIEAKVTKKIVETGEIFNYELKLQGEINATGLQLPSFEGFQVLSQSQFQSYSSEGGVNKTLITLTYLLFASEPGTFTITPAILLENGKKKYQSQAITIKVKGESLEKKQKILPYIEKGTNL